MEVRVFGIVREIAGSHTVDMDCAGLTVREMKNRLTMLYPRMGQLTSFMIAVNGTYAGNESIINASDEVAVIPPVSGG